MKKKHENTPHYFQCEDAIHFMDEADRLGRRRWIYRGHSVSDLRPGDAYTEKRYRLDSSLLRHLRTHEKQIARASWHLRERDALRRFKQAAPNYLSPHPVPHDDITWLAVMQHYGSPTRLLDFTFNPAVALFFALRNTNPGTSPWCVEAIRIDSIRGKSYVNRMNAAKGSKVTRWPKRSEYKLGQLPLKHEFVGVIDGSVMNPRQAAQEGVFVVPSRIDLDIEAWLASIKPDSGLKPYGTHWVRFVFENTSEVYYDSVRQLMQMGMSPVRLFPGLEGLSEAARFMSFDPARACF